MKRLFSILLVFIMCVGFVTLSYAQSVQQPAAVVQPVSRWDALKQQASVKWNEWKAKAITYWEKWNIKDERVPSSSQGPVVEQQTPENVPEAKPNMDAVVNSQLATLPSYKNETLASKTQVIKDTLQKVKTAETHVVSKAARVGSANIPKSKSGVPIFSTTVTSKSKNGKVTKVAIKNIPLLDIGEEAQVSRKEWALTTPELADLKVDGIKPLSSPATFDQRDVTKLVSKPYEKAVENKKLEGIKLALPEGIDLELVKNINYKLSSEVVVSELPYTPITEDRLNLIKGLILAEYNKKCHLATGLLKGVSEKLTSEESQIKDFYYASCLHEMGFYTDSVPQLMEIAKKGVPQYSMQAIDLLVKDIPREFIKDVGTTFKTIGETQVSDKAKNSFNFYIALSDATKHKYDSAFEYALKVKADSPKYLEAQYLAAVSEYKMDRIKDSVARQEQILKDLNKYKTDVPLESLVKMNLGRTAYRNKDYKKALENYQFISKDNPMWIQALTEQGWMQLLSKDAFGAIGNMYSLHSPFFNAIYKPESYVVRTIGYLNICQYGDAYKTLSHLENFYRPYLGAISSFKKQSKSDIDYYNYVIANFKSKAKETDGRLPMTLVKEISRQRDFVNLQSAVNNSIDQDAQYGFIKNIVKNDTNNVISRINSVKRRINELTLKIDGARKKPEMAKFVNEWKQSRDFERETLPYLQFEKLTYMKSLEDFKKFEADSKVTLSKWSSKMKTMAGATLKDHLVTAERRLAQFIENNEFLRYEVYAGSGENIRYISAGGSTERRMSAAAEPKDAKQKWNFDGEFWADEIGHYRSTLKDNCPQSVSSNVK